MSLHILTFLLALTTASPLVQGHLVQAGNGTFYDDNSNENSPNLANYVYLGWMIFYIVFAVVACCCAAGVGIAYVIIRNRRKKAALAAGIAPPSTNVFRMMYQQAPIVAPPTTQLSA